jgi:hypothetical protein
MKRDLALIVRMIYTQKPMTAAGPDEVGAAFEKALSESFGVKQKILPFFRPPEARLKRSGCAFVATTSGVVLRVV